MKALSVSLVLFLFLQSASAQRHDFGAVDAAIEDAVAKHDIPGAVLLVNFDGKTVHRKAYGHRAIEPAIEPMTVDTVFDIASLTKVFTAAAVLDLVRLGKVRLNDATARYLPDFAREGKQDITVRMLLTHHSGLAPDLDLATNWHGKDEAFRRCMQSKPIDPPGARFIYSDINYEVLGFLVEKVSGKSLPEAITEVVLRPLEMSHTGFLPSGETRPKIAPTTADEAGTIMRGTVHDPTARRMGGVAGHAGLYSTAEDLARFAKAMITRKGILTPLLIEKMTSPQQPSWSHDLRGFGWDIDSPFANNRGELLTAGSFGHTGYTGTSMWMDPLSRTFVILLTNAVHPREGTDSWGKIAIRGKIMNAVVSALAPDIDRKILSASASTTTGTERGAGAHRAIDRTGSVLTGIDVLEANAFAILQGKRVGLLTNQTGIDGHGKRTIDVLAQAPGVRLVKLFSVEHGILGLQDSAHIEEQADLTTKLPVVNVYGAGDKQRPTREQLSGIDVLLIDLQDLGVRFYTYEASMANFLAAAAEIDLEVIVLDRPNPLTGAMVQGPVADAEARWPNFPFRMPLRHGMTMGELARLFNAETKMGARLTVVPMQGWTRSDWFDSTGLLWVNPSPNMRSLDSATVYPGVAMLEAMGSNISVGRGTDTPFEILGAPWISAEAASALAKYLNQRRVPGIRFVPRMFTPQGYIFQGQSCGGLNLIVIDRNLLDSPLLGAELISALVKFYPNDFHAEASVRLIGNRSVVEALIGGIDPKAVALEWQTDLGDFSALRTKYLLY